MSWAEKNSLRKTGKDPLKYYKSLGKKWPLAYRQAIYQEKNILDAIKNKELNLTKMKTFEQFVNEGTIPTGYLKQQSSHSVLRSREVQSDKIKDLRNIIKSKLTSDMYNFIFTNPQYAKGWSRNGKQSAISYNFDYSKSLKKLLNSLKDKYPEIGDNLESLYCEYRTTDSGHTYDEWTNKRKLIYCEINGHRTHFASGLPNYLRGIGFGFMLYVNFLKFLGYGRSAGDSSEDAQNMWKKIIQRDEFYGISTESDVLVISKNIIGKVKPFSGKVDSSWLFNSRSSNIYTENDIYTIIVKFMKNQNRNSLNDISVDRDLYKNFPEAKRKIENLLKFNQTTLKEINVKELLKSKDKDFIKIILENDEEFILCILNIYKNVPNKPPIEGGEMVELSNKYMGDKYDYVINIPNNTLNKRTKDNSNKYEFTEKIKKIYFMGEKSK